MIYFRRQPPIRSLLSLIIKKSSSLPRVTQYSIAMADKSIHISPLAYPQARRDESLVEDLHGHHIKDPYRWLEDPDSKETEEFVTKLNEIAVPFLEAAPGPEKLRKALTKLWNYPKFGCPSKRGDFYYYWHNSGLQNQYVLYQQDNLDSPGNVFLDPNKLAADGTSSINTTAWTNDGTMLAYGISEKGSDWVTVKFKRSNGEDLSDVISNVKHSGLVWTSNNEGVFYSKYPSHQGATEGTCSEKHKWHSLYFHQLGTDCETADVLVADFRDNEDVMVGASITQDGRYLIVNSNKGCDPTNQLYFYDLAAVNNKIEGKLPLKSLFVKSDASYDFIDNDTDQPTALILTNHKSPMFKLVRVPLDAQADDPSQWETIIAEDARRKLDWVSPLYGERLLVCYLEDVKTKLYVHDRKNGKMLYPMALGIGNVGGIFCKKKLPEVFISFESFVSPGIIYRADFSHQHQSSGPVELKEHRRMQIEGLNAEDFDVKQVFYSSKDGTLIPMYIISAKGVKLDGTNPVILNGYGGFNVSLLPDFALTALMFVKHYGGVFVKANLRGGSEYGEDWHEAGMLERKQTVFDDFISAAEYLIDNKYTSPNKLAIQGGSNGGLLVAACCQQRSELFGAVVGRVGVLDMLRFHKFTIGGAWVPEFGNPDNQKEFEFIYKYSPLHNIRLPKGVQWPSTLLTTADHDDRVVPAHTLKYVAQLYHYLKEGANEWQHQPVIVRVDIKAGHGAGKPTEKCIAEIVDIYSFLERVLEMKWKDN